MKKVGITLNNNNDRLTGSTIKDVAQMAGVSIATVSRILNGTGVVSTNLVAKVQTAIKELNYQPNALARALKIKESRSIGLIIPDIENPFFPALVHGVEDAAQAEGYAVILCNTDGKSEEEEKYIKILLSKQVDGILFAGNLDFEQHREWLADITIPFVLLDRRMPNSPYSAVLTDNRLGAFMAVEHLIKLGKRHIAMVGAHAKSLTSEDRTIGYIDAHLAYECTYTEQLMYNGDFSFEGGYKAAETLINDGHLFDAVFAASDMMAIGVIECLTQHGRLVPDEIAVVGFDDIHLAAWYKPALTTINQPVYDMGKIGLRMLVDHITKKIAQSQEVLLVPQLVIRQSSCTKEENK